MKKLMLLPLLASAGLLFCSCGKQTAETVSASAENTSENTESQNSVTDTNNGSVPEQTVTEEPEEITEEEPFYYYEGDYLIFGTYEQDGVYSNGPEPIEWMILEENENGTLLLSRYVLEVKPYNEERGNTEWETCTLRKWLNDDFCHEAFTDDQIALINDTTLKNPESTSIRDFLCSIKKIWNFRFCLLYLRVNI